MAGRQGSSTSRGSHLSLQRGEVAEVDHVLGAAGGALRSLEAVDVIERAQARNLAEGVERAEVGVEREVEAAANGDCVEDEGQLRRDIA
jgi:hypothetical protein